MSCEASLISAGRTKTARHSETTEQTSLDIFETVNLPVKQRIVAPPLQQKMAEDFVILVDGGKHADYEIKTRIPPNCRSQVTCFLFRSQYVPGSDLQQDVKEEFLRIFEENKLPDWHLQLYSEVLSTTFDRSFACYVNADSIMPSIQNNHDRIESTLDDQAERYQRTSAHSRTSWSTLGENFERELEERAAAFAVVMRNR